MQENLAVARFRVFKVKVTVSNGCRISLTFNSSVNIFQARDMKPQDGTDSRPILVAVGQLLAPDHFQMVLDADNTDKSTHFSFSVLS